MINEPTRRELWETLVELIEAIVPLADQMAPLYVTGLTLDLPIDLSMKAGREGLVIYADLPRWRWSTVFDAPTGRMHLQIGQ
jgi:hypothetical protein